MIITPKDISDLNSKGEFLAYKGKSSKNILFLGSCRLTPIMYYLSLLRSDLNIFCIYAPFWGSLWDLDPTQPFPKKSLEQILSNTHLMITESIKNISILNTSINCQQNLFNEFGTNIEEIRLPNYVLSVYLYDMVHKELRKEDPSFLDEDITKIDEIHAESKQRLTNSITKSGFDPVNDFISDNFKKIKMFSTINHPTTIVSMLTFKILAERLEISKESVDFNFFRRVADDHLLSSNSVPVTKFDIEHYDFEFKSTVFENEIIKQKNMHYRPSEEEIFINDEQIKKMISYS